MKRPAKRAMRRRRDERGAVLVGVLWIALMIGVVGGAMALLSQRDSRMAHIAESRAKAEALLDAAYNIASLQVLEDPDAVFGLIESGAPMRIELEGGVAEARFGFEANRIDLNAGDIGQLTTLFTSAGAEADRAAQLAAAVIDFRDPDDLRQLNGAEALDYRAAGLPYEPRNGPFLHVSELAWVLGVDPGLAARAGALATAHATLGARPVRHAGQGAEAFDLPLGAEALLFEAGIADPEQILRMRIDAETALGAHAEAVAVIYLDFSSLNPLRIVHWERS